MNRILKKLVSAVALGLTVCLFSASLCSAVAAAAEPTQERTIATQQYDGPNDRFKVYLSPVSYTHLDVYKRQILWVLPQ